MVQTRTVNLNRRLLGEFLKNPQTIKAFEDLSLNADDVSGVLTSIQSADIITLSLSDAFENQRVLSSDGEVQLTDGGPGGALTVGLSDTGVNTNTYGDASHLVQIAVNAKGRITLAQVHTLDSDNVTEGVANLFFTEARVRGALSGGDGIDYDAITGEIGVDATVATLTGTQTLENKMLAGMRASIRTAATSAAIAPTDTTILIDATAAGVALTLPAASANAGRVLSVKKIDSSANAGSVVAAGADLIDGAPSVSLTVQYQAVSLHCDGAAWWEL